MILSNWLIVVMSNNRLRQYWTSEIWCKATEFLINKNRISMRSSANDLFFLYFRWISPLIKDISIFNYTLQLLLIGFNGTIKCIRLKTKNWVPTSETVNIFAMGNKSFCHYHTKPVKLLRNCFHLCLSSAFIKWCKLT